MMDHEQDKHPHAEPLMSGPPDQLKRHQEKEQHSHDHINYDFYRLLFHSVLPFTFEIKSVLISQPF